MARTNGKRSRKWLWLTAAVIAALGVWVATRNGDADPDEKDQLRTAKVEVGDVQVRVSEVGSVEPLVKVDVKSVLSGKVVELRVREGDKVTRGQVLARVEPDVNQARDLSQVKNAVEEAEIGLNEARATHERNRGLFDQGLLSKQADLETETRYRQAKANYEAALEKYRIVQESGVPIALADAGAAQRLNVTSPMDGLVIRREVELGDTVMSGVSSFNAGTVLATVADVDTMIIKAGINEVDIGKVRLAQPVKITLDAYPKVRFEGTIERIAPAARLEEKVKVFDVEIAIDRQGAELRTGMTANIDIVGDKREGVLTVPVEAIFKRDEADVVYVKKAKEPEEAQKRSGFLASVFASDGDDEPEEEVDEKDLWKKVEILEGLEEDTEVAVEDPTRPKDQDDE
jgi:HlyD family secretion protein